MATYLVSEYDTVTNGYRVYQDGISSYNYSGIYGVHTWFAIDLANEVFYVVETGGYVLRQRTLANGTLTATEFQHVGTYGVMPVVVDNDGYLWTIDYATYANIRRWSPDLTSRDDYTLPAELAFSTVLHMAFTYSGDYLYVAELDVSYESCYIAKIQVSDFSLVWEVNVYGATGFTFNSDIFVDENDDVYLNGEDNTGIVIKKLLSEDGSVLWTTGYGYGFYYGSRYCNSRVYSVIAGNKIAQLNSSTGVLIASSAAAETGLYCTALLDENTLVAVGPGGGILNPGRLTSFVFDISSDWSEGENWTSSAVFGDYCGNEPFRGDAAGHLNDSQVTPAVAEFSGTPRTGVNPLEVTFTDASSGGTIDTWSWDFGDGETSNDQNPVHTYDDPGLYTVALTVTNTNELSDTETKVDYINVYNSATKSVLDELAIRMEDAEQQAFTETVKLKALTIGQLELTKLIASNFIPELQTIHSSLDCSDGEIALSELTYSVLKDKEGILAVKVTIDSTEYWAIEINQMELDRLENDYFYATNEIFFYVQESKIKIVAQDLTGATADVFYVRMPSTFTIYESPDLQSYYDNLTLCLAEKYCWLVDGHFDRAKTAKDMAIREITILNRKYEDEQRLLDIGVSFDL